MSVREQLTALNACSEAVEWAAAFQSLQAAWDACERGDWMLWLVGKCNTSKPYSDERKPLVRCCLEAARLAWDQMPKAGRDCIELYERWCAGEALAPDDLRAAADAAAYAAAYAAYAAAYAAADAAYAAAHTAAYAAGYAAYAARALKQSAAIVRRHYPVVPGKE